MKHHVWEMGRESIPAAEGIVAWLLDAREESCLSLAPGPTLTPVKFQHKSSLHSLIQWCWRWGCAQGGGASSLQVPGNPDPRVSKQQARSSVLPVHCRKNNNSKVFWARSILSIFATTIFLCHLPILPHNNTVSTYIQLWISKVLPNNSLNNQTTLKDSWVTEAER